MMGIRVNGYGIGGFTPNDARICECSYWLKPDNFPKGLSKCFHYIPSLKLICFNTPENISEIFTSSTHMKLKYPECICGKTIPYCLFCRSYDEYLGATHAEQYAMEYTLKELANLIGFDNIDEVVRSFPPVPESIQQIADTLSIFKDKAYIKLLHPMEVEY